MTKHTTQIAALALLGARMRLADIDAERDPLLITIAALERQTAATPTTRSKTTRKKPHWTQTPEGKRKMSRLIKAHHKRRKAELRKTDK